MTIVFPDIATLESTLPLPSGTAIGDPLQSIDGRAAICHPFTEEDLAVFVAMPGVLVLEELPADWQCPEE